MTPIVRTTSHSELNLKNDVVAIAAPFHRHLYQSIEIAVESAGAVPGDFRRVALAATSTHADDRASLRNSSRCHEQGGDKPGRS
jgi:hypothetical protein